MRLPKKSARSPQLLITAMLAFMLAAPSPVATADEAAYEDLVALFHAFRQFQQPTVTGGIPDYSAATMKQQYKELRGFQARLAAIDPSTWPVAEQIDYHLVRAEMNGMEFYHRVVRPWARDPGFYMMTQSGAGPTGFFLEVEKLPIPDEDLEGFHLALRGVPALYEQARVNLTDGAADFVTLALHFLGEEIDFYGELAELLAEHHPELVADAERAAAAVKSYGSWLEENRNRMTAEAGVGKDNYNWLLKNVYLFPYTWDEIRTIVELEDNRVITFGRLEQNRNRNLAQIEPVQSQAEYRQSVEEALDHIMTFLAEEEIFTMYDYLVPGDYLGSWHGFDQPWPEKHDYFFNFSHRDPVMEETHEMVGHHFDELRAQNDTRPIRRGRRPYKINTARDEGHAFALEELLMHAGYLDGRSPGAREIAYEQAAFRTVRALSDVYLHSRDWVLEDALEFCIANAPHGELLDGSHHLWYELATTLRGVGHHMLMVVGKVQYMKLFRDRANQLGNDFVLKDFMDEFYASGFIPMSLIRWEMTGLNDEMEKLAPPRVATYDFSGDLESRFYDHPAWGSHEASLVQTGGAASLTATGTHTSEAWKTWHEPMPHDRGWSIAVDVTVPLAWDTEPTPEAQVGAGPWLGRLDDEGKGRRVYEVNLATIANEFRFVQGQLIENRLGEDPIAVGMALVAGETVRLEVSYTADPPTISLTVDGTLVDTKTLDGSGFDNWGMTGDDVFYGGIMGFAENSDLTRHPVTLDNFAVEIHR
jgi:uncharacterized protein (DUF885 family)